MESAEHTAPAPATAGLVHTRLFAGIVGTVFAADQVTKLIAADRLQPPYMPHPWLGEVVRFTLVYNPGAAFGLHLGPYSRWIFIALTLGALGLLWRLYKESYPGDLVRVVALALVTGGAIGNLVDRLRSGRGVVDFLDVGIGASRWPTFNVADIGVSCGAVLLAIVLWREDTRRAAWQAQADADALAAELAERQAADRGAAGATGESHDSANAPVHG
jgi:signal peptidase II